MQLRKLLTGQLGFTMVELLVVISIIGILATAVLAALNPVEQLKKGRDTSRKADAQTLLGALDRFQASFGCYPWQWSGTACSVAAPAALSNGGTGELVSPTTFASGNLLQITTMDELKSQFQSRNTITQSELWLSVNAVGQASVCFEPESLTGRGGSLGPIRDELNGTPGTPDCSAAYVKIDGTSACAVCVPQ